MAGFLSSSSTTSLTSSNSGTLLSEEPLDLSGNCRSTVLGAGVIRPLPTEEHKTQDSNAKQAIRFWEGVREGGREGGREGERGDSDVYVPRLTTDCLISVSPSSESSSLSVSLSSWQHVKRDTRFLYRYSKHCKLVISRHQLAESFPLLSVYIYIYI